MWSTAKISGGFAASWSELAPEKASGPDGRLIGVTVVVVGGSAVGATVVTGVVAGGTVVDGTVVGATVVDGRVVGAVVGMVGGGITASSELLALSDGDDSEIPVVGSSTVARFTTVPSTGWATTEVTTRIAGATSPAPSVDDRRHSNAAAPVADSVSTHVHSGPDADTKASSGGSSSMTRVDAAAVLPLFRTSIDHSTRSPTSASPEAASVFSILRSTVLATMPASCPSLSPSG